MLRGFFLGGLTTVLVGIAIVNFRCFLLDSTSEHFASMPSAAQHFLKSRHARCGGVKSDVRKIDFDFYKQTLSLFQATSDGGKFKHLSISGHGDYVQEKVRFTYHPSFKALWLFSLNRYADEWNDDAMLSVKIFDPNAIIGHSTGDVGVSEIKINTYSIELSQAEFDVLKRRMIENGLLEKRALGERMKYPGTNEPVLGTDGQTYYVEATLGGEWALVKRSTSDVDFSTDFVVVQPLLSLAQQRIPQLSDSIEGLMNEIVQGEGN